MEDGRWNLAKQNMPSITEVCLLMLYRNGEFRGHATGFAVEPRIVVTAAHNFTLSGADMVGVYPGYDAVKNPDVQNSGYKLDSLQMNTQRDIAVFVTIEEIGRTCHFATLVNNDVKMAMIGYGVLYENNSFHVSAGVGTGRIKGRLVEYDLPVSVGDSGGPVIIAGSSPFQVLGLHTNGANSKGTKGFGPCLIGEEAKDLMELIAKSHNT